MDLPELEGEPRPYDMHVDGASTDGDGDDRLEVSYPYTGETWATVPDATTADVDAAVAAARRCYESDAWADLTATDRGRLLYDLADRIEANVEKLSREESLSNGKLYREMHAQATALPEWYRYYAGLADKVGGKTLPVEDSRMFNFTLREPYGVVGAITAWNSPLMLLTYKLAPAVAAGNTVVAKPSEVTPVSALRLAELATEAGFPPGAFNVVTGGVGAGAALSDHDDVDKVAFTGGLEAGRAVARAAGDHVRPVTLELGGKSANVVFADADLDTAVTGVVKGIFAASGQTCVAGSRLLVERSVHDEFVDRLLDRVADIRLGDPFAEDTEMAPIATERQCERVLGYVEGAREAGATVAAGGDRCTVDGCGRYVPPTVLTDVTPEMTIVREEVFGPVLTVVPFSDEADALAIANDSEFGLAAGVWTNDLRRGVRMSRELEAGVVWVNTYRKSSFTTPFGGYKKSGVGREKGVEAIDEYLQTKSVWIETEGEVSDPFTL
jgi:aldehyde dehydrogenase (NAD+)